MRDVLVVDGLSYLTVHQYTQAAITIDLSAGAALYDFTPPLFADELATAF